MQRLCKQDLKNLLNGATFMASGGGGSIEAGKSMVDIFPENDSVNVFSVEEACAAMQADNTLAVVVAIMGAPEKIGAIGYPLYCEYAIQSIQQHLPEDKKNRKIGFLVPVEIGPISSIAPCVLAHKMNLAVIDGDGAGRAVPSLTNLTFDGVHLSANPTVLSNKAQESIALFVDTGSKAESLARPVISDPLFDQQAGIALWVMDDTQLLNAVRIKGTLALSQKIGKKVTLLDFKKDSGPASMAPPIDAIIEILQKQGLSGRTLFTGKLESFKTETSGGFDHAQLCFRHPVNTDEVVTILTQNESLIAYNSTLCEPLVMAPDSICCITEKGQVFTNADIDIQKMKGTLVTLIGISARPELRDMKDLSESFRTVLMGLGYAGKQIALAEQDG